MAETTLFVYADGACSGNPGPGGYGYVIQNSKLKPIDEGFGYNVATTNNAMELVGVREGITRARYILEKKGAAEDAHITVRSDSAYLVNAFNKNWVDKWRMTGWKTIQNRPVANYVEWITLLEEIRITREAGIGVRFEHVQGHAGIPLNEQADQLAVRGRSVASTKRLNSEL